MRKLLLLSFSIWIFAGYAQNDTTRLTYLLEQAPEKEQLFECSNMMNDGYFYQANLLADKLLARQPNNCNYNFRKGYILMELHQDYVNALPFLEKAVEQTTKIWDQYSTTEQKAPTDALFVLARCYHLNLQIDKAKAFYNEFISTSNPKSANILMAKLHLKQCEVAAYELAHPKTAIIENLQSPVNTALPEYSPVISLDGSALYYTSRKRWEGADPIEHRDDRLYQYPEDIYVSYLTFDSTWTDPLRIEFCDPAQNEATMAVSQDERRIYLYQDTEGSGDVFYSNVTDERFKKIDHIENKQINTSDWETHCTVTPDGKTMYFVSNKKGGFGGRDIYRCDKLESGEWGKPENCGPTLNSPFDEESPFISVDNKTLYFSSNGETSMGGFDIFQSILDSTGKWSKPMNLGHPFNSCGDDLFYTTTFDGYTGYLTSVRPEGKGEKDIYMIKNDYLGIYPLAVLKGNIRVRNGAKMPEDLAIDLKCKSCENDVTRHLFPRFRDGFFMADLGLCTQYDLVYTRNDGKEVVYTDTLSTNCGYLQQVVYRELWLDASGKLSRLYFIDGTIRDSKTNEVVADAKVTLKDASTGEILASVMTDSKGYFVSDSIFGKLPGDPMKIHLDVTKTGYAPTSVDADITFGGEPTVHLNEVINPLVAELEVGTDLGLVINPIYFDYRKWNIRPDAAAELDKIVKIMKDNPKIKIALGSHTDARGTDEENRILADKRAKSSVDYIISKGIARNRITGTGYGESQLKVSNEEIDATYLWVDKEKLHQLNRRTEFIIVAK